MYNEKAIKRYEEGRILHQKGRLSDAERAYKKALKINPNFVEALNNLGNVLVDKGRLTQAGDAFTVAIAGHENHAVGLIDGVLEPT